jgi:maltose/moltooligosaccharide transporter
MKNKPNLSFWQIWNMSFGFLGIQFGFALQNANTSRIFETLGAEVDQIGLYWLAAPVTGLLVQPLVGYFSDKTWTRWGRRKPYFLVGAVLASISLIIMPHSPVLWMAIGTLWILDSSINICMEPFRAFVGDKLNETQRPLGFFTQSFFIGTGAVVGSALPYIFANWLGLSNTAEPGVIPESVRWSFYCGAAALVLTVGWTLFRSTEYPPTEEEEDIQDLPYVSLQKQMQYGVALLLSGLIGAAFVFYYEGPKELTFLCAGLGLTGTLFLITAGIRKTGARNGFTDIITDLLSMPSTMQQLASVQFFTWFGLFAMWIYCTQAVTGHVFHATDPSTKEYNEAADWVSLMFAFYSLVCALVSFLLPTLAKKLGNKETHLLALSLGGLGLMGIYYCTGKMDLLLCMFGVGIAWASILSMPYTLLANSLPPKKMGYYMGVFNFFIVIPQIVAGTLLGLLLRVFFGNDPIYAMIIGGVSFLLAGILTLRIDEKKPA